MKFQLVIALLTTLALSGFTKVSTPTNDHANLGETIELRYQYFWRCTRQYGTWGLCNRDGKIKPLTNVSDIVMIDDSGWIAAIIKNAQTRTNTWKLIGPNGKIIPETNKASIVNFLKENRAPVKLSAGLPFSYCTESGDILKARFDQVSPFSDGIAAVRIGKSVGFIGLDGNFLPNSKKVTCEFSQGISQGNLAACVDGRWGYLDTHGNWLVKPIFDLAEPFSGGFALVRLHDVSAPFKKPNCISYINKQGKLFNQRFHSGSAFENGYAAAAVATQGNGRGVRWGLIDKAGQWAIEPNYIAIGPPIESTRILYGQDGVGLAYNGKVVAPATYAHIGSFSEGLATFQTTVNGTFGYIDRNNKVVLPARYDAAAPFSEGLAAVRIHPSEANGKSKTGFVNTKGVMCLESQVRCGNILVSDASNSSTQFHEGVCMAGRPYRVKKSQDISPGAGFMNRSGEWVTKDVITKAYPFRGGHALVRYYPNSEKANSTEKAACPSTR